MAQLSTVTEGPVKDMVFAINHYVSTGDHIGEGVAMEGLDGGVPVRRALRPQKSR
jgi:hypothetical protein